MITYLVAARILNYILYAFASYAGRYILEIPFAYYLLEKAYYIQR